jgi:two-component system, NarL family, response regulator NreC
MRPASLRAMPRPDASSVASPASIRVVLADDHAFMRHCLRLLLDAEVEFEVVAEASDVPTVVQHVHANRPHVLVLDLSMPGGSSLTAIRRLRSESAETEIVVTTMADDACFAHEAIGAGASGYVLKDTADRELPDAIRRAAKSESFISGRVVRAAGGHDVLSEREVDVLRLIALGRANAEIASLLQISIRTVETRRAHIHRKLGLATRVEFVRYALRRELLTPPARRDGAC